MGTEVHYFTGQAKWAKLQKPDDTYGKYTIDLVLDHGEAEKFKALKLKNTLREEDGKFRVTLRRDPSASVWNNGTKQAAGPPAVVDPNGHPIHDLVGNGSEVTVKLVVYDYNNKFGRGRGSRLESVRVDKLLKYEGKPDQPAPSPPSKHMF